MNSLRLKVVGVFSDKDTCPNRIEGFATLSRLALGLSDDDFLLTCCKDQTLTIDEAKNYKDAIHSGCDAIVKVESLEHPLGPAVIEAATLAVREGNLVSMGFNQGGWLETFWTVGTPKAWEQYGVMAIDVGDVQMTGEVFVSNGDGSEPKKEHYDGCCPMSLLQARRR